MKTSKLFFLLLPLLLMMQNANAQLSKVAEAIENAMVFNEQLYNSID
jgi:hypothetical protein